MWFQDKAHDLHKQGAAGAVAAFAYIVTIVLVITIVESLFAADPGLLAPVVMLCLLVLSAAVMAVLIFGRPAMLYVDGKKKEALQLLGWTIGSFAGITALALLFSLAVSSYLS